MSMLTSIEALGAIASVLTILMFIEDCIDRFRRRRERRRKMMSQGK